MIAMSPMIRQLSDRQLSEPLLDEKQQGTTSMLVMTANFVTGGLGIGMLSLPWSAAGASVLPAIFVNALVLLIMADTCCIIAEASEKYQTFDLGALVCLVPGRLGRWSAAICDAVIWVSLF